MDRRDLPSDQAPRPADGPHPDQMHSSSTIPIFEGVQRAAGPYALGGQAEGAWLFLIPGERLHGMNLRDA